MTSAFDPLLQKIDPLIPAGMRHQPGKREGLVVRIGRGGVYISHLDIFGNPLNFTSEHREWIRTKLLPVFPNLDTRALLGRSSESVRRFNSMARRLEHAQKRAASGEVIAIESLDLHGLKPRLNIQGSQLSALRPGDLTRAATYVSLKPEPPRRIIIMSDFPLFDPILNKKIIPDEIIIFYPLSDDELKAVRSAKPPAVFTPFLKIANNLKKAADINIKCCDINKEIFNEQLIEHFEKTMRGLITAASTAFGTLGIEPTGKVAAAAIDSLLHSAEAKISDPNHAELVRHSARRTKLSMTAEFVATKIGDEIRFIPTKLEPYFSESAAHLAQRLSLSMVVIATAMENVLMHFPKK